MSKNTLKEAGNIQETQNDSNAESTQQNASGGGMLSWPWKFVKWFWGYETSSEETAATKQAIADVLPENDNDNIPVSDISQPNSELAAAQKHVQELTFEKEAEIVDMLRSKADKKKAKKLDDHKTLEASKQIDDEQTVDKTENKESKIESTSQLNIANTSVMQPLKVNEFEDDNYNDLS